MTQDPKDLHDWEDKGILISVFDEPRHFWRCRKCNWEIDTDPLVSQIPEPDRISTVFEGRSGIEPGLPFGPLSHIDGEFRSYTCHEIMAREIHDR